MNALVRAYTRLTDAFAKPIDGIGLALFRVLWGCSLLGEMVQWFSMDALMYRVPPYDSLWSWRHLVWTGAIVVTLLFIVGLKTRTMATLLFVLSIFTFGQTRSWEYHNDYVIVELAFLLPFAPLSARLSVDAAWARRRGQPWKATVPRGWAWAFLFLGAGLTYFDSVFYKWGSPMWRGGLGMWFPASMPWATWAPAGPLNAVLNQRWLVLTLSHLTLAFETAFLFVFWTRRARLPLLCIGMGLHLGIMVAFPIPWFGLGVAALYALLIPHGWLRPIFGPPDPARRARWSHLPGLRGGLPDVARLLPAVLAAVFVLQSTQTMARSTVGRAALGLVAEESTLRSAKRSAKSVAKAFRSVIGVHPHPVFLDMHFQGYNHIIALVHRDEDQTETWLPLIDEQGQAAGYNRGRGWVYTSFRTNRPRFKRVRFKKATKRWTAYWAAREGLLLDDLTFEVRVKVISDEMRWERDRLLSNMAAPWQPAGTVHWRNGVFGVDIADIEAVQAPGGPS